MKTPHLFTILPLLLLVGFSATANAQNTSNPRSKPVGERSVPVGRESVPVGAHSVPVGERSVKVGARSQYTNLDTRRFEAMRRAMNHPDTKSLYEGSADERYAALQKRFISVVKNRPEPAADEQAAIAAQAKHDRAWGDAARKTAGSHLQGLFDQSWWNQVKDRVKEPRFYYAQDPDADWNKSADWATLAKTLRLDAEPLYFDYGRNIVMRDDVIYVHGQKIAGHRDAVGSARRLSATPPPVEGMKLNWIPLGTFILSQNSEKQKIDIAIQLVCGDEGTITGSYYEWNTGHTEPILGRINFDTQRIGFQIKNSRIVMETGLANLTRDEARIWAHLPDGRSPVWLLARVK